MATTVTRRTIDLAGLEVPLVEATGSEDGPLLTVISGVHGCEYASMDGVRRWTRSLENRELRGRVRAVPVLNLPAFHARTPFLVPDDGKNLNRCFPGDPVARWPTGWPMPRSRNSSLAPTRTSTRTAGTWSRRWSRSRCSTQGPPRKNRGRWPWRTGCPT